MSTHRCQQCSHLFTTRSRKGWHYCSSECSHLGRLANDSKYRRALVFERDNGVCAKCGVDCKQIAPVGKKRYSWEVDHIHPQRFAGRDVSLDGLRTLCVPCHNNLSGRMRQFHQLGRFVTGELMDYDPDWEAKTEPMGPAR